MKISKKTILIALGAVSALCAAIYLFSRKRRQTASDGTDSTTEPAAEAYNKSSLTLTTDAGYPLKDGSTGRNVGELQQALNKIVPGIKDVAVTGTWDAATTAKMSVVWDRIRRAPTATLSGIGSGTLSLVTQSYIGGQYPNFSISRPRLERLKDLADRVGKTSGTTALDKFDKALKESYNATKNITYPTK